DGIDLTIEEGEFVVLLGPSGCGKTTTLRMISGLEEITAGELLFDGSLVNDEPPDRRSVGMVFQSYALYPHMTVAGNLSFGLQSRRKRGSRRNARRRERQLVMELAELLELEHVLDHRPKELSGGQRQRVALGRALIRQPGVFLLDEPLSNLDANLRDRMRMELARLHERLPVTTVYVTHDQGEGLTLADRLVVMNEGRICQVGAPSEVYDRPANTFVAGFIGSPGMNLWTPQWSRGEGGDLLLGGAIRLPPAIHGALGERDLPATVGIRPEHLFLVQQGADSQATLSCRVEMVEHLGSHLLVHAALTSAQGGNVVAQLDPKCSVQRGEQILLGAPPEAVHLFEAESGLRVSGLACPDRVAVTA
ncbi:MAG: ABC transporter ATP-binding protein, partial [Acidimicrobiales bacterium]